MMTRMMSTPKILPSLTASRVVVRRSVWPLKHAGAEFGVEVARF
jgi:hypothetical protein